MHYGGIRAVKGIDLEVAEGELVCLIGANGAGKTTTLKAICRLVASQAKVISYAGQDISRSQVHELPRRGLVMVPEGRGIFPQLTVEENLAMGAYARGGSGSTDKQFATFPRLKERRTQVAGTLSGGEQQMLAIARALMGRPKLLLLDEPSLGLAPLIVKQIFEVIKELNSNHGLPVFIVEQNAYHSLRLAHRGYVMVNGRITLSGSGSELLNSEEVQTAYLDGGRRKEPQGASH